jgi:hypothetical protein
MALERQWHGMFEKLVQYKDEHDGSTMVPQRYQQDPPLGQWAMYQRRRRKRGLLSDAHIGKLDSIGFVWEPYKSYWEEMLGRLVEFKNDYGHCKVPEKIGEYPRLGLWVRRQRYLFSVDRLHADRKSRLDNVDFIWKANTNPTRLSEGLHDGAESSSEGDGHEMLAAESSSKGSTRTPPRRCNKRKRAPRDEDDPDEVGTMELSDDSRRANRGAKRCHPGNNESPSVGQRVAVYWSDEDEYYPGAVSRKGERGRKSFIEYDDGDREWIRDSTRELLFLRDHVVIQRLDNPHVKSLSVGSRVAVWWTAEERYFPGVVSRIDFSKPSPHCIEYDDGDRQWVNLAYRRFLLLMSL